jgi:hypothetical protein
MDIKIYSWQEMSDTLAALQTQEASFTVEQWLVMFQSCLLLGIVGLALIFGRKLIAPTGIVNTVLFYVGLLACAPLAYYSLQIIAKGFSYFLLVAVIGSIAYTFFTGGFKK